MGTFRYFSSPGSCTICTSESGFQIPLLFQERSPRRGKQDALHNTFQFYADLGTWWVGDSVGILIFTPITLIFLAQPRYFWRVRISTVAMLLLALITLVMILFFYSKQQHQASIREKFDHQANTLHISLKEQFQSSVRYNRILKAFFDNSGQVTRKTFQAFTVPLLQRHTYMVALEWIPRVKTEGEKSLTDEQKDWVDYILSSGTHLLKLDKMKCFNHLTELAGKPPIRKAPESDWSSVKIRWKECRGKSVSIAGKVMDQDSGSNSSRRGHNTHFMPAVSGFCMTG